MQANTMFRALREAISAEMVESGDEVKVVMLTEDGAQLHGTIGIAIVDNVVYFVVDGPSRGEEAEELTSTRLSDVLDNMIEG